MLKELATFSLSASGSNSTDLPPIPGYIEAFVLDCSLLVTNTDAVNPRTIDILALKRQFEFDLQRPEGQGYYFQALDIEDLQNFRYLQTGAHPSAVGTNDWRANQVVAASGAVTLTDRLVIPIADPRAADPRDYALEAADLNGGLLWRSGANQANFTAVLTFRICAIYSNVRKRGSHLGLMRRLHSISYTDIMKATILDGHFSDVMICSFTADFTGHGAFTWQQDGEDIIPSITVDRLLAEAYMQPGWAAKDILVGYVPIKQAGPNYSTQSVRKHRYGLKWASLPANAQKILAIEVIPNTPDQLVLRRPEIRQIPKDHFGMVVAPRARDKVAFALTPDKMQAAAASLLSYSLFEPATIIKMGKLMKKSEGEIKSALNYAR